ncbi:MAG: hypothetical protein WBG71_09425 [Leeuwenhoekiella sp.]
MNLSFKKDLIPLINAGRTTREKYAAQLLQTPEDIVKCLDFIVVEDKNDGHKAAWILEIAVLDNWDLLLLNLNRFIEILPKITNESSLRPLAKITETLCKYSNRPAADLKSKTLSPKQKEKLLSTTFQWLITPQKTAVKVFAMQSVYELGIKNPWVHDELKAVLLKDIDYASAGYRSRAKKILQAIKNLQSKHL